MSRMSTTLLKRKIAALAAEIDGGENTPITVRGLQRQKAALERQLAKHATVLSHTKGERLT